MDPAECDSMDTQAQLGSNDSLVGGSSDGANVNAQPEQEADAETSDMTPVIAGVSVGFLAIGVAGLAFKKYRRDEGLPGPGSKYEAKAQQAVVDTRGLGLEQKSTLEDDVYSGGGEEMATDLNDNVSIPVFDAKEKEEEVRRQSSTQVGPKKVVDTRQVAKPSRDSFMKWQAASANKSANATLVEAFEIGTKLVLNAVDSDKKNDVETAYDLYTESLEYFNFVLVAEQSPTKRAVLEQRVKAYEQRADTLAGYVRAAGDNSGGPNVGLA